MWNLIPQSVKDLHSIFQKSGKKLFVVGGSVRDFLTGDKPKDFDLATDALPDEIIRIIGDRYKTNSQGKSFGVIVVYTEDEPGGMEIATFREDISKGRNPEVRLGVSIEQDVLRRDLRINGLFYDLDKKEIIDLTGGREDLEKGMTRMIGDPHERFDEDSLRILRAFRFASRYNHPLDEETKKAIEDRKLQHPETRLQNLSPESGRMERISQERIWEEFKKAFHQAKDFNYYLQFFTDFDMWNEIFPNSNINTQLIESNDLIVILANLLQKEDTSKLERKMVQDWKIEIDVARPVIFLIDLLKLSPQTAFDLYKQKKRCPVTDENIKEWIRVKDLKDKIFDIFLIYKPSVSAEELMAKGIKGAKLGETIKMMEIENFKKLLN